MRTDLVILADSNLNHPKSFMRKTTLLLAFLALQSCISIEGVTSDYGKLNEKQKALITDLDHFGNASEEKIYKINGAELKTELEKYPQALVYLFKNGCTSDHCKPLVVYDLYAKKHGLKLFLVMNGYASLNASLDAPHPWPLYAIDNVHYDSNYRNKYSRYFENEMLGKPKKAKEGAYEGNLYFFRNGKLEKITNELPNS